MRRILILFIIFATVILVGVLNYWAKRPETKPEKVYPPKRVQMALSSESDREDDLELQVRAIGFGAPHTEEEEAETKRKIAAIHREAMAGVDLAELAKKYSANCGDYTLRRGERDRETEEACFALEEGEMTGILKSDLGYYIIKLLKKRQAMEVRFLQITIPRAVIKSEREAMSRLEKVVEELRAGADFADVVRRYSLAPDAQAGGDSGYVRTAGDWMPKEMVEQLMTLEIGQRSDVFKTELGWHIVKLIDRLPVRGERQRE